MLLDHFEAEQQALVSFSINDGSFDDENNNEISSDVYFGDTIPSENKNEHRQISLGQDHACSSIVNADSIEGTLSNSLRCWWMTGSDFGAHSVPAGMVLVV